MQANPASLPAKERLKTALKFYAVLLWMLAGTFGDQANGSTVQAGGGNNGGTLQVGGGNNWGYNYPTYPTQIITGYDATSGLPHYLTVQASPQYAGIVGIVSGNFASGSQVSIFSNPTTGWKFTGWSDGNTQSSRNVLLQSSADVTYTANFVQKVAAKLLAPSNASPLTSTAATFYWDIGVGVDQYKFQVGSTVGGSDIIDQTVPPPADPATPAYSLQTILPGNVGTFHVRVSSLIDGQWQYNDYTYNMLTPASGSTLTSYTPTFTWDTGTGAAQYALAVGSTPGGSDIFNNAVSGLSQKITLPDNAQTIYMALYSYINGVWEYNIYSYTQQDTGAVMSSPANRSSLTSTAVNFTWNASAIATQYALWVGSSPKSYDLYAKAEGSSLTDTVNLPADGRTIYVNLWSMVKGVWTSESYTYTTLDNKAKMTTPAGGSTLTSGSVTFNWGGDTGVSQYALWVGSAPGTYDLYAKAEGNSVTDTVNLPTDGRRIYVRLYSMMNGAWKFNGYTYTAYTSGTDPKAALTSPANGSTLPSGNVTFNWSTGTGVSQYAIWAGSAPDTYDLYAAVVTGTSKTVTLPTDGRPVYVNFWSMINGVWQANKYLFTAATQGSAPKALITSPANGSILTSGTLALNWNAGSAATQYALWVGSAPNTYDLYAGVEGTNLSKTLQLPLDGRRLYVTLWSLINGAWQPVSYYYDTTQ